jgi:RimJ/RimL family protein N-acetyltransferase
MLYNKTITLKDSRECVLRNGTSDDGAEALALFNLLRSQTDNLLTYPDENPMTVADEIKYITDKNESGRSVEIFAVIDGKIVGNGGFNAVGNNYKDSHRAEFGICIHKDFWGLGIGRAITEACIECAKTAGYSQLELSVVAENERAIALYKKVGFSEFGRNPKGLFSRYSGFQELVMMRKEL